MTDQPEIERELSLIEHLVELRSRVIKALVAVILVVLVLVPFARQLYTIFSAPLVRHLPEGTSMIAIDVASPFFAPFKLVLILGLLLAMPVVLYQLWAFVAPGLYRHEQRLARPLLAASLFLFYAGCAFAYFVVFPVVFAFFTAMAPEGVAVMTDINRYLDFVLALFLAFGLAFQVPVATIVLVALGITTPEQLGKIRGYVIIGAFTIAMLITPPDMISQTLLALPVMLLYEVGIVMSRVLVKGKEDGRRETEDGR
jgi:sec-independent protein translocase protein TatC